MAHEPTGAGAQSSARRWAARVALLGAAAASLATSQARWELTDSASAPVVFSPSDSARTAVLHVEATHELAVTVQFEATWVGVGQPAPLTARVRAPGVAPIDLPIVTKPGPGVRGGAQHVVRPCSSYPCRTTLDISVERPAGVSERLGVRIAATATISGKGDSTPPAGAAVSARLVSALGSGPLDLPTP